MKSAAAFGGGGFGILGYCPSNNQSNTLAFAICIYTVYILTCFFYSIWTAILTVVLNFDEISSV